MDNRFPIVIETQKFYNVSFNWRERFSSDNKIQIQRMLTQLLIHSSKFRMYLGSNDEIRVVKPFHSDSMEYGKNFPHINVIFANSMTGETSATYHLCTTLRYDRFIKISLIDEL